MTANNPESGRAGTGYEEGGAREETSTGLDENIAGALSYLLGFITGVIFLVIEDENEFVRFHAAQSIATFGALFVVSIVFSIVNGIVTTMLFTGAGFGLFGIFSLIFSLIWLVISLGSLGLWLFLMFQAYQGKTTRLPVVAGIADSIS